MNKNKMPKIALGTWSWGSGFAGGDLVFGNNLTDTKVLEGVFKTAIEQGLTLWDTASVYGMGSSETLLGTLSQSNAPGEVIFSTKFTPQIAPDTENPAMSMCDISLERLGSDYIDFYWIHNPSAIEELTHYLGDVYKSGKIKRLGLSNHNMQQIMRVKEILEPYGVQIGAIQNHFSLLYRSSEDAGILQYCRDNDIPFFAYMTLEQGALTGKYDSQNPMPKDSQRGQTYNPVLVDIEALTSKMNEIGKKYNASISEIAIAWAIAKGTIPVVGVTKEYQVLEAKKATMIALKKEDMDLLEYYSRKVNVDTRGAWEAPMN